MNERKLAMPFIVPIDHEVRGWGSPQREPSRRLAALQARAAVSSRNKHVTGNLSGRHRSFVPILCIWGDRLAAFRPGRKTVDCISRAGSAGTDFSFRNVPENSKRCNQENTGNRIRVMYLYFHRETT